MVAAMVIALGLGHMAVVLHRGAGEAVLDEGELTTFEDDLADALQGVQRANPIQKPTPLARWRAAECEGRIADARWTAFVTWRATASGRGVLTRCLQAQSAQAMGILLRAAVRSDAPMGFVKLDVVTRIAEVPRSSLLVASLSVRPGVDGVCRGRRCLMPWQLLVAEVFDSFLPVASVPSARLGASIGDLAVMLGSHSTEPMQRVETRGWLVDRFGRLARSGRTHQPGLEATEANVRRAARTAENYIAAAQRKSGRFRYIVEPFTGRTIDTPFSVARQAGTTLALCELGGDDIRIRRAIGRSL